MSEQTLRLEPQHRILGDKTLSTDIRIYVADLAAHNNGKLHGVWINATDDLGDIREQVSQMLAENPEGFAEEYAIHDYEGFGGYALSEYEGLETAHEIACFIEEYPDFGGGAEQFRRRWNQGRKILITALQMLFDIHTAMQDAGNFDPAFSGMTVKNHVFTNTIFEIAFPDVIACAAKIGSVC